VVGARGSTKAVQGRRQKFIYVGVFDDFLKLTLEQLLTTFYSQFDHILTKHLVSPEMFLGYENVF
jgi:hypothetical protein